MRDPSPALGLQRVDQYFYVDESTSGEKLAGPFSQNGLALFLIDHWRTTSQHYDFRIYSVATTSPVLRQILESPWSEIQEVTGTPETPSDLF